jgi:hypothetical protein
MMVLPVNVGGNAAAQGNVLCTRHDRREPTARQKLTDHFRERRARLRSEQSGKLIEGNETTQLLGKHYDSIA